MPKYECKGIEKKLKILKKIWTKKSEIFQEIFRNLSAFVGKTVLIRKVVLFLGFKKLY